MVLLSLAVVFAGIGIFSLTGSDSEDTAAAPAADTSAVPTATAAPTGTSAPSATAPPSATSGSPTTTTTATTSGSASGASSASPIRVLNNSEVSGLAAETATRLESAGFAVGETGNYSSGVIAASTVYYDPAVPGQQAQAERIARTLGFGSEPRFAGIANASPGIVVIVTR
ncbi:LytR C-terminal domain-containing protein [Rhodococcus kroppenstedtii]|uniref:LytR C-terminal domain-containing protein n=2 Tax=Mycobacteriales TaxID=85007 RepID=A0ABS7NU64_9NOCA|nr:MULTISPECIES: LytR C-terminal domain-containing protein [Rhodococcus]MBY6312755.1 LytR C-terminal domain-containing protein [Rhodococcus kroppenstedtii]MBY6320965.1 LytR C-terminal domain-containing protein [Rhodococcus kroppenstedtii]MBY6399512.1 LytR C-terminal domain-containing protein [Rhodococcus kroppenstedtii]